MFDYILLLFLFGCEILFLLSHHHFWIFLLVIILELFWNSFSVFALKGNHIISHYSLDGDTLLTRGLLLLGVGGDHVYFGEVVGLGELQDVLGVLLFFEVYVDVVLAELHAAFGLALLTHS